MLSSNKEKQQNYELVSIEDLVPADHMLRKIDKFIDFTFIDEKVRHLWLIIDNTDYRATMPPVNLVNDVATLHLTVVGD